MHESPIDLPTPASTWTAFLELMESGELQEATRESFTVLFVGGVPGVVLGILAGLVVGASRPLDTALSPYIFAFFATPFPALIPIFVLLFGLGVIGKGMIVFTLVVTTVLLQTVAGVKSVDPRFLESARSFGSSRLRMLFEVQLPAALSFIVAGHPARGGTVVGRRRDRGVRHRAVRSRCADLPARRQAPALGGPRAGGRAGAHRDRRVDRAAVARDPLRTVEASEMTFHGRG